MAELSLASRTGLLDLSARAPFSDALAWAGLPGDLLHARRAGRLGQDQAARGQPIGEADPRAGDHENVEKPVDPGHARIPPRDATRAGAGRPGEPGAT